jgi:hypothetical protein
MFSHYLRTFSFQVIHNTLWHIVGTVEPTYPAGEQLGSEASVGDSAATVLLAIAPKRK